MILPKSADSITQTVIGFAFSIGLRDLRLKQPELDLKVWARLQRR
jgi:hypothetical protein